MFVEVIHDVYAVYFYPEAIIRSAGPRRLYLSLRTKNPHSAGR